MKSKYNSSQKKFNWKTILITVLIFSSTFTLLDAFLIPKAYAVVNQDQLENSTQSSLLIDEDAQIDPLKTNNSYIDNNISINIEKVDKNGVVFYVADVEISDVSFLKTAFAYDTFGKNITETTSEMAEDHDAIFAINGDYYGFRDIGLVIRNGVLYRDISGGPLGDQSLIIDSEGDLQIVDTDEISGTSLIESGILQGFTFGPVLVEEGKASAEYNTTISLKANPRTAIGQISPLHYIFIVVEGRSKTSVGMMLEQLAQEFIDRGATVAYNLDGGGSSAMVLNGILINTPAEKRNTGERNISDIIYIGY